eukprot:984689-Lingulodinium_polyedra.AAC.1
MLDTNGNTGVGPVAPLEPTGPCFGGVTGAAAPCWGNAFGRAANDEGTLHAGAPNDLTANVV